MDLTPEAKYILTALMHMRRGFIGAGLPMPVLTLPEHAHGERLMLAIRSSGDYQRLTALGTVQPLIVEGISGAHWQIDLVGIKVRWPALRVAKRGNAWEYV